MKKKYHYCPNCNKMVTAIIRQYRKGCMWHCFKCNAFVILKKLNGRNFIQDDLRVGDEK